MYRFDDKNKNENEKEDRQDDSDEDKDSFIGSLIRGFIRKKKKNNVNYVYDKGFYLCHECLERYMAMEESDSKAKREYTSLESGDGMVVLSDSNLEKDTVCKQSEDTKDNKKESMKYTLPEKSSDDADRKENINLMDALTERKVINSVRRVSLNDRNEDESISECCNMSMIENMSSIKTVPANEIKFTILRDNKTLERENRFIAEAEKENMENYVNKSKENDVVAAEYNDIFNGGIADDVISPSNDVSNVAGSALLSNDSTNNYAVSLNNYHSLVSVSNNVPSPDNTEHAGFSSIASNSAFTNVLNYDEGSMPILYCASTVITNKSLEMGCSPTISTINISSDITPQVPDKSEITRVSKAENGDLLSQKHQSDRMSLTNTITSFMLRANDRRNIAANISAINERIRNQSDNLLPKNNERNENKYKEAMDNTKESSNKKNTIGDKTHESENEKETQHIDLTKEKNDEDMNGEMKKTSDEESGEQSHDSITLDVKKSGESQHSSAVEDKELTDDAKEKSESRSGSVTRDKELTDEAMKKNVSQYGSMMKSIKSLHDNEISGSPLAVISKDINAMKIEDNKIEAERLSKKVLVKKNAPQVAQKRGNVDKKKNVYQSIVDQLKENFKETLSFMPRSTPSTKKTSKSSLTKDKPKNMKSSDKDMSSKSSSKTSTNESKEKSSSKSEEERSKKDIKMNGEDKRKADQTSGSDVERNKDDKTKASSKGNVSEKSNESEKTAESKMKEQEESNKDMLEKYESRSFSRASIMNAIKEARMAQKSDSEVSKTVEEKSRMMNHDDGAKSSQIRSGKKNGNGSLDRTAVAQSTSKQSVLADQSKIDRQFEYSNSMEKGTKKEEAQKSSTISSASSLHKDEYVILTLDELRRYKVRVKELIEFFERLIAECNAKNENN